MFGAASQDDPAGRRAQPDHQSITPRIKRIQHPASGLDLPGGHPRSLFEAWSQHQLPARRRDPRMADPGAVGRAGDQLWASASSRWPSRSPRPASAGPGSPGSCTRTPSGSRPARSRTRPSCRSCSSRRRASTGAIRRCGRTSIRRSGVFRSLEEMQTSAKRAEHVPAQQAAFRQLYLNEWRDGSADALARPGDLG